MYGMIHKAAREYCEGRIGKDAWDRLMLRCDLDREHFISGKHYDDETTMRLLSEIRDTLGCEMDQLLFEFGHYWISFTQASSYAAAMKMLGDDMPTFMRNLDSLHQSVQSTMPEASLPSFVVIGESQTTIELLYRSNRDGLETFVKGLLTGLMDRFGESGDISSRYSGSDLIFTIERKLAA